MYRPHKLLFNLRRVKYCQFGGRLRQYGSILPPVQEIFPPAQKLSAQVWQYKLIKEAIENNLTDEDLILIEKEGSKVCIKLMRKRI